MRPWDFQLNTALNQITSDWNQTACQRTLVDKREKEGREERPLKTMSGDYSENVCIYLYIYLYMYSSSPPQIMASVDMELSQNQSSAWRILPDMDDRVEGWVMLGNPAPIVTVLAFYVYLVKVGHLPNQISGTMQLFSS